MKVTCRDRVEQWALENGMNLGDATLQSIAELMAKERADLLEDVRLRLGNARWPWAHPRELNQRITEMIMDTIDAMYEDGCTK